MKAIIHWHFGLKQFSLMQRVFNSFSNTLNGFPFATVVIEPLDPQPISLGAHSPNQFAYCSILLYTSDQFTLAL